jgi:hypothetical protein
MALNRFVGNSTRHARCHAVAATAVVGFREEADMNSQIGRIEKEPRTTQHRRAFLGTAALALPALSQILNAQTSAGKVDGAKDSVTKQVERELAATIKRAEVQVRGEHLRAVAANLRILHVHYTATGVWVSADKSFARLIARKGGTANLALAGPDKSAKAQVDAAIRALGVQIPHHRSIDTQALTAAFEALQKDGYAKTIAGLATNLDRFAAVLDDEPQRPIVVAALRQAYDQICQEIYWNMVIADASCLSMSIINPIIGGQLCILAYFLHHYYTLNGCH